MIYRSGALILLVNLAIAAPGAAVEPATATTAETVATPARNPRWAQPLSLKGVPNFYRVSKDFYRAAQIDASGIDGLSKPPYEIKTVISLRGWHDDLKMLPEGSFAAHGVRYERIEMKWGGLHPEKEDVVKFLKLVATAPKPILVHCLHGADRTGFMTAVYRIAVEGWTAEEAIDELKHGHYGANKIIAGLSGQYLKYLNSNEFQEIKREAALSGSRT
jgi:protein tyrosine phosphatase (PTP) superfamily phosphohydrolase (DUF442 family)